VFGHNGGVSSPTPKSPRRGPIWAPPEGVRGSWPLGAVYSAGFYIAASLAMTLGEGFGGIVDLVWIVIGVAWAGTAGWLIAHRGSRLTGIGMVASVVAVAALFLGIGAVAGLFIR
jgi:hypothetical protein